MIEDRDIQNIIFKECEMNSGQKVVESIFR